jgi:predicted transcriptional regulator
MEAQSERSEYLLEFFKLLADEKRLQIVGLLSRQEYTVEELATILQLSTATTSHHLQRLMQAGLVRARASQHYHVYSLCLQTLRERSQQILSGDRLQEATQDLDLDAYDRKILSNFLVDGRLKQIPSQPKKREVILRYLAGLFERGRRYAEREVNEIIGRVHEDYASFRRELVDSGQLSRDHDVYWRAGEGQVSL